MTLFNQVSLFNATKKLHSKAIGLGFLVVLLLTVASCSEYQKALKSEDIATKFKLGTELYDAEKYSKANKLFAQIAPQYRGKPQAEKLMYMYATSFYKMKDYYLAGYQFERFEGQYPKSEKAEEALFLSAKSFYQLSPVYSKEQKETITAIEKLQMFINKYPDSEYLPEANTLIQQLDFKLEKKAFEIAKLYNNIANYESEDYEASIKAFDNFLLDYPGTSFREDAMFYRFDSAYKLGINSIERRREERINIAIKYYNAFYKAYPESQHSEQAAAMNRELQTAILAYTTKS